MRSLILILAMLVTPLAVGQNGSFAVLAYHDVRDNVTGDYDADQFAISTATLIEHFTWLRQNGFTPVSVDDLLAAQRGERPLPDKAVLLTFDDGRRSFYTHVLPLLKIFGYPALASIVTSWIDAEPNTVDGGRALARADFMTWQQLREAQASGLVEIASHSHALHRGIPGNPQGNELPAAVTLLYGNAGYESTSDYTARITADLAESVELIRSNVGRAPRVIAWPFGSFNTATRAIATRYGMALGLTLSDGVNNVASLGAMPRHLLRANAGIDDLGAALLQGPRSPVVRAAQVDLDYVYDADAMQQERNLDDLVERMRALEITHVFLQAFADPDADGGAQALYFPNSRLPMRADLFNRVAWQLKTRANVLVYAWLPLLSFEGNGINPEWRVQQRLGHAKLDSASEPRLSPFEPQAVALLHDVYRDLARHAAFDGVLFHDDGRFNAQEDASPAALRAYRARFGADFTFERVDEDASLQRDWATFRSQALIDLSRELMATVREYQPNARTARNLFASALLTPNGALELAQEYAEFLSAYDYVTLMAMPYLEDNNRPHRFYRNLAAAVRAYDGFNRTIFEVQTVDWRNGTPIPAEELREQLRYLQSLGARHLAYYPDDFITGHPALQPLREGISIAVYPPGSSSAANAEPAP
jgi:biofilm PGA synthesis lipoprotein PgaB